MNTTQALNILKPEDNGLDALKRAYRDACKKYHPDVNPDGLELMKLINCAYECLLKYEYNINQVNNEEGLDIIFQNIINKIKHLPGIQIEICGSWIWVSGNTKPIKDILKETGLKYAFKKKMWYFRPEGYKKRSRKVWDINEIRNAFGSDKVENEPLKAFA